MFYIFLNKTFSVIFFSSLAIQCVLFIITGLPKGQIIQMAFSATLLNYLIFHIFP